LVLFASLLLTNLCAGDDRIVAIDLQAKLLTTEQNGILRLYRLADATEITVNGAKATVQQLLPGQTVAVKTADALTAAKIAASGLGQATAPARSLALRSVTVQMRVDGSDRVLYQDGKLWIEHHDAKKPTDIVINGVEWSPEWKGEKAEPFTNFVVPVAPIVQGRIALKQFSGRGKAKLEHIPAAPVVVMIEDGKAGADNIEFQISW
jgi:hypothetical protein